MRKHILNMRKYIQRLKTLRGVMEKRARQEAHLEAGMMKKRRNV